MKNYIRRHDLVSWFLCALIALAIVGAFYVLPVVASEGR
jgi:hypothetical protein